MLTIHQIKWLKKNRYFKKENVYNQIEKQNDPKNGDWKIVTLQTMKENNLKVDI